MNKVKKIIIYTALVTGVGIIVAGILVDILTTLGLTTAIAISSGSELGLFVLTDKLIGYIDKKEEKKDSPE